MKPTRTLLASALTGLTMALSPIAASATIYQFSFLANPDAGETTADKALDVLHTITIDSDKIASFNSATLRSTSAWLGGGITMTMTHAGKTVTLNEAFDPTQPTLTIPGSGHEGFLDLSGPTSTWFFSLEFAPGNPFIDKNQLPYDPFVYGFLFIYQDQKAYKDFRDLWAQGKVGVLAQYAVTSVPEPSSMLLTGLGLAGLAGLARRQQRG